jgi:hypothetical protein
VTIGQAIRKIEQLERAADEGAKRGSERLLSRGLSLAKKRTSGRRSLAELRRRDHPYATRHGSPLLEPSIVNIQSGRLLSRWYAFRLPGGWGGSYRGRIINDDPATEFLDGTRVMFPRPVARVVSAALGREAESLVAREVARAISRVL